MLHSLFLRLCLKRSAQIALCGVTGAGLFSIAHFGNPSLWLGFTLGAGFFGLVSAASEKFDL